LHKISQLEAHRLSEVNNYIKQVIALNFEDSIWIIAEISQFKATGKHAYLELIEKDEETAEVIASVSGVIWFKSMMFIKNKLGDLSTQILTEGTQIQCKVKLDFHPKYGLKFVVQDIDPSYTFGQLELERQKTIERLQKEALIAKNKEKLLPLAIRRIAIISSEKAAGLQDFLVQLEQNPYNYKFSTQLFKSSVQGTKLEKEMLECLSQIDQRNSEFDCVAIIRGGGSKLDLSGFDSYSISKKVAEFSLPVITGIGHDIDQNVIELVAHSPLKTPTAVANYILDHNLNFEAEILDLNQGIFLKGKNRLVEKSTALQYLFSQIRIEAVQTINEANSFIEKLFNQLMFDSKTRINNKQHQIDTLEQQIILNSPKEILKKGYQISYQDGKAITLAKDIRLGEKMELIFSDGKIEAIPEKFEKNETKK